MIFNSSKMCKGHKCLKMCNLDEVTEQFNWLLDLLSEHTQEVRVVEPPPRCKHIAGHPGSPKLHILGGYRKRGWIPKFDK